jgi:sugar phosphate permease
MSVVFGGAIAVGKMWLKPISALAAGFLGDRIGPSRTIVGCFLVLIVSFGALVLIPGRQDLVLLLVVNVGIASLAIFGLRGIYFALLEEGGVPLAVTGTATGVVSVLGYTPDIYMPFLGGVFLDAYPGRSGYQYFFMFITGLCVVGLISAWMFLRKYSQRKTISRRRNEIT